jgi:hypothetical protein
MGKLEKDYLKLRKIILLRLFGEEMIELSKSDYILGMWIIGNPHRDLLFTVKRGDDHRHWVGSYRTRYYEGNKIFDSDDKKNFIKFEIRNKSEEEVINDMLNIQKQMTPDFTEGNKYPCKTDHLIVKGNLDKFFTLAESKDWIHVKKSNK